MLALLVSFCVAFVGVLIVGFYSVQRNVDSDNAPGRWALKSRPWLSFLYSLFSSKYSYFCFVLLFALSLGLFASFDESPYAFYAFDTPSFSTHLLNYFPYAILMFLCVLALIDVKCLALPDSLNFLFLFLCLGYAVVLSPYPLESVMFGFGVGGVAFAFKIFYQSVREKDILGEADIILLSALGIAYGVFDTFCAVFGGSVIALVYILIVWIRGHKAVREMKLPFVFFVFLGQCLNQFFYLSLLSAEILDYA